MSAGELEFRLRFEERRCVKDRYGNRRDDTWVERLTVWSGVTLLRGGEAVIAARLVGTKSAILKIRVSRNAREVRSEWRAVDVHSGEVWHIKEPPRLTPDRAYLEMLAQSGVPN
jgi:head-tail adaptor